MKRCQKCGNDLQDNMSFCPYCGRQYLAEDFIPQYLPQKKKKRGRAKGLIIAGIIILVALLGITLFLKKSGLAYITADEMKELVTFTKRYATMPQDEFFSICENVSYDNLARYPDHYKFKPVSISGRIMQVMHDYYDDGKDGYLLITDTNDIIICSIIADKSGPRILEDDCLTLYGLSCGLDSYTTVNNVYVTVPSLLILDYCFQ